MLSLVGLAWNAWTTLPVPIRFAAGLIAFGLAPGLLIVGPFVARRSREIDATDFIISAFTCSFSCNLLFNVALFTFESSFAGILRAYLLLQVAGYAAWGVTWLLRASRARDAGGFIGPRETVKGLSVALGAAVLGLTLVAYLNGSPPASPEELVSLRKLADNPVVRYDNISFRSGDPSTYLFVPFQILIVGTSLLARLDVVLTYSLFWAVTTMLSIVVITRLAYVMFGRADVAAIVCVLAVAIGFFDPRSVIDDAGIVTPYPNRYGFGSGVLLPLGLLLFWSILRDRELSIWRWALLIYVVIETTFVHARETILSMGAMTTVFLLMAARPRKHSRALVQIAGGLVIMTAVLLAYKHGSLTLAPQLGEYVASLSEASRGAVAQVVRDRGIWSAVVTEAPGLLTANVDGTAVQARITTFGDLFVHPWNESYPGRLYFPVVLLTLPLYALWAGSFAQLSLAALLAGLGIITASGFLQLHIATVVGSPEIFVAYNIAFLATLFILADEVGALGRGAAERWGGSLIGGVLITTIILSLVAGAFVLSTALQELLYSLAASWTRTTSWQLLGATVFAILYRITRRDLPLLARPARPPASPLAWMTACGLVLVVLMPAIRDSELWQSNPFRPKYPPGAFTGALLEDYDLLRASGKLAPVVYPVDVVRFLRESVPAGQTILSRDTFALLLTTPHFAAIVSNGGVVPPSYIANSEYLTMAGGTTGFDVRTHIADSGRVGMFRQMLERFEVDLLITDPTESLEMHRAIEGYAALRGVLESIFDSEGFTIYRVALRR